MQDPPSERFRSRLKTRHLVLLSELGRHGSIAHAAVAAHMTQPAASKMLAEVEHGRLVSIPLHAPELIRPTGIIHRKKKKLTRAGRQFLSLVVANEEQNEAELVAAWRRSL